MPSLSRELRNNLARATLVNFLVHERLARTTIEANLKDGPVIL